MSSSKNHKESAYSLDVDLLTISYKVRRENDHLNPQSLVESRQIHSPCTSSVMNCGAPLKLSYLVSEVGETSYGLFRVQDGGCQPIFGKSLG